MKYVYAILFLWSASALAWDANQFHKPEQKALKEKLTSIQYEVTQNADTERPFHNDYWNNHDAGIYVDVVSGEPLFSSLDKFDSGTGWPSFTKPLVSGNIMSKSDHQLSAERTEVRSQHANSHLGHVFDDGPKPTGKRFCINSAALRFIPVAQLTKEGYGEFVGLFKPVVPTSDKVSKLETATFAAGCFWGTEEFFRKIPGVMETRVGFTGGTVANPKYEDTHDGHTGHAEAVEIKFDPAQVSYEHLLDQFFKMHDPTTKDRQGNDTGSQYRSAIFFHGEKQKAEALAFKQRVEKSKAWKAPLVTEIAEAKIFWPAEDEHQKYLVKHPGGYDNHYLRKIAF